MTISLAFEILVSLLLMVTIGYCFVLDRRLKALRSGQDGVRQSIVELVQATLQAEQSVQLLTKTGTQITQDISAKITEAKRATASIQQPIPTTPAARPNPLASPLAGLGRDAATSLMDRLKQAGAQ
ncbi:MAG: hypothetical protein JKX99_03025 [Robiginitomaculum sp.]|nr:hypothetical protein [Robiginitomaculum sp.]